MEIPASGTSASSSKSIKPPRKTRSIQACNSCRKHKTRCEILDGIDQPLIRCHRCKVLGAECSYQTMDRSLFETAFPVKSENNSSTCRYRSDPNNSPRISSAPIHNDIFPNLPHQIWSFLRLPRGTLDWTAPLEAIQGLMKRVSGTHDRPPPPIPNDTLEAILSPEQIDHLIAIFEHNYLPWLNFNLIRDRVSPFLNLACCVVASRHLGEGTRSVVAPRLQALFTNCVAKMILQSRKSETLESIQCLLILSLWVPVCGIDEGSRDGRLLIASAVTMAMNMRLNEACDLSVALRESQAKGEEVSSQDLLSATDRARLWLALTNVESLLCTGSGRHPLSKRTGSYLKMVALSPDLPGSNLIAGQDLRLRLLAELFDITEAGIAIRLRSLSDTDIEYWHDGFMRVLGSMDRVTRILTPLPMVAEFDGFYFKTLHIIERSCRSLILYHACLTARQHFVNSEIDNPYWFRQVRPRGLDVLLIWGKESVAVAESVLVTFLEADVRLLGTMPDYMFNMIAFASSFVTGVRFLVIHVGVDFPGSIERLLERTICKLNQCSLSSDSAAAKCSALITAMLKLWMDRMDIAEEGPRESSPPPYSLYSRRSSGHSEPGTQSPRTTSSGFFQSLESRSTDWSNPGLLRDTTFWNNVSSTHNVY
ncbi:hypothetical protein DFJ43DRAFT_1058910 [Lentinula guzmanii]|uniref:Zn(2)-C6 fungal-type domain-containing protein n=1 Tax=Lentinula guzmanii TaxID=2804957 RepID=A0AA38JQI5_9AGAR|nr:hypothetical protein DFJ43DRAFT_1058910 [Lentinula guzmanii]